MTLKQQREKVAEAIEHAMNAGRVVVTDHGANDCWIDIHPALRDHVVIHAQVKNDGRLTLVATDTLKMAITVAQRLNPVTEPDEPEPEPKAIMNLCCGIQALHARLLPDDVPIEVRESLAHLANVSITICDQIKAEKT